MEEKLNTFSDELKKGFYVNNVYNLIEKCETLNNPEYQVPVIVLKYIFLDLAARWEDKAVSVEEIKYTEEKMAPAIESLLYSMDEKNISKIWSKLNELIHTYKNLNL